MRTVCIVVLIGVLLGGCTRRQNPSTCITGDQKSCPCLGGGDGVQLCQADGTYGACQCAVSGDDMAALAGDDMAASQPPIDMARVADLLATFDAGSAFFYPDIQADLDAKGCTITACHGTSGNGSVMYVKPMATAQADIDMNQVNVTAEINFTTPDQSKLLRFPLAGSGSGHAGTTPFANTSDPTYQRWLNWIKAGAPKQ